jgi:hypothetical protein
MMVAFLTELVPVGFQVGREAKGHSPHQYQRQQLVFAHPMLALAVAAPSFLPLLVPPLHSVAVLPEEL